MQNATSEVPTPHIQQFIVVLSYLNGRRHLLQHLHRFRIVDLLRCQTASSSAAVTRHIVDSGCAN